MSAEIHRIERTPDRVTATLNHPAVHNVTDQALIDARFESPDKHRQMTAFPERRDRR